MTHYVISQPDELYHYGVKGMKWGVRKAVNKYSKNVAARKKAKLEKLKSDANQGVTNLYKNPVKMTKQTRARAKLYDMDTKKAMKGKSFIDAYAYKYERYWKRPALSVTGKETTAGKASVERMIAYAGSTVINLAVTNAMMKRLV